MSGTQDIVIAGGVENMTALPIGSASSKGNPFGSKGMQERYPGVMFSQFEGAEILAQNHNITRAVSLSRIQTHLHQDMEEFAVLSHTRAHNATQNGYFNREIVPVTVTDPKTGETSVHDKDEGNFILFLC